MKTQHFSITNPQAQQEEIRQAAEIIKNGGLLGIPTETVYGLGANGLDAEAVRQIFLAKGRPQDNPLILHIPNASWLERYCCDIPPVAYELAETFWPGPLTMILRRRDMVPDETTAGLTTVGMRCPDHEVTRAIILAADVPVAAPSGNLSGRPSPTCAAHMVEDMEGKIHGIVDGGACGVGVESTIVDLTGEKPRLLRPGGLPLEQLCAVLGEVTVDKAVVRPLEDGERPAAPGMKYRHYAPKAPVTVVLGDSQRTADYIRNRMGEHTGVICFQEYESSFPGATVYQIGSVNDRVEQARSVFDALRYFDSTAVTEIFAQCPDERGLGFAIGNRLKKAAGFSVVNLEGEPV